MYIRVAMAVLIGAASMLGQGGRLFTGIEIASSHTRGLLLEFHDSPKGRTFFQVATKSREANYISMRDSNGNLTEEGLDLVAKHVTDIIEELKLEAKARASATVPEPYIVASSGIGLIKNREALQRRIFDRTSEICMDFIGSDDEARYGRLFLPSTTSQRAIMLDCGGGTCKGGYMEGTQFRPVVIDFGIRVVRDKARELAKTMKLSYNEAVQKIVKDEVMPAWKKAVAEVPGMTDRKLFYLYGGIIWHTANWSQPAQVSQFFSKVSAADFDQLLLAVLDDEGAEREFRRGALPANTTPRIRTMAEGAFAESKSRIDRDSIIAGVTMIRAILKTAHPEVQIEFPRQANWLPGYAIACKLDKRDCNLPSCRVQTRVPEFKKRTSN